MQHPTTFTTDQEAIEERLHHLGQDPAFTYYAFIEGGSYILLNGSPSNNKEIGSVQLPSAIQIAYLVNTASDPERRQAAREGISKMYTFLKESEKQLSQIEKEEEQKAMVMKTRSAWIADTPVMFDMDTKACECWQYRMTGDCWCDETCSALNGCSACLWWEYKFHLFIPMHFQYRLSTCL